MIIETERLLLRPWKDSDLVPYAALNADPRVREFFPSLLTREQSDQQACDFSEFLISHGWGVWAVALLQNSEFIGFIGLDPVSFTAPFTPAIEIGWRLAYAHWGHGYAVEGAKAVLKYAFETIKLEEVVSMTARGNLRSQRVMHKIGLTYDPKDDFYHPNLSEGHPLRDHVLYRITRQDWLSQQTC